MIATPHDDARPRAPASPLWRTLLPHAFRFVSFVLVLGGVLFGVAGRVEWLGGWLLFGTYVGFLAVFLVWGALRAQALLEQRRRPAANVKRWDRVIVLIYTACLVGLLVVGALDGGRFRWSHVPLPVTGGGTVGLVGVFGWLWWVASTNAFLSRWARMQDDRGQQVVTQGPYRLVRHPMYAAMGPGAACAALTMQSWWALVPAVAIAVLFVIRTALEDRMLRDGLPGYREYAELVRYRLMPGLW